MKTLRIVIIIIVFSTMSIIISCFWGETTHVEYSDIAGFNVYEELRENEVSLSLCRCSNIPVSKPVRYDSLCILLVGYKTPKSSHIPTHTFSMIGQSRADNIEIYPTGYIENISVFSDKNYNRNLLEGDTLNKIFNLCVNFPNDRILPLENVFIENLHCSWNIGLILTTAPDSISEHTFKIIYEEIDGTELILFTKPVVILP